MAAESTGEGMSGRTRRPFDGVVEHYEASLVRHAHGASAVNWRSDRDAAIRYSVMLDLIRPQLRPCTLLDFGCGLAGLLQYLKDAQRSEVLYSGLDVSPRFAEAARRLHPEATILCLDVLQPDSTLPHYDYIVMNGVFTRRQDLSIEDMTAYLEQLTVKVFLHCRVALAFNVMSPIADWKDKALYYPDMGGLISFIGARLSRHIVVRNDYGLFETTYYVYRTAQAHMDASGGQ